MVDENEKQQQAESNAERDQDHGKMNNGAIGGNMGTIGESNTQNNEEHSKKAADGNASNSDDSSS